jgi:hypothetical protein
MNIFQTTSLTISFFLKELRGRINAFKFGIMFFFFTKGPSINKHLFAKNNSFKIGYLECKHIFRPAEIIFRGNCHWADRN